MKKTNKTMALYLMLVFLFTTVFSSIGFIPAGAADDGLIAYYNFEGTLNDLSPNGNNGTSVGDITFVDAINGKGAAFDGKSYIEVNSNSSLDITKSFSYSVWVKAYTAIDNTTRCQPILFKKRDNDKNYPYEMTLAYHNCFMPYNYFNGGSWECRLSTPIDRDKWTMVTVTWDGQSMKFYTDGKFKGNSDFSEELYKTTGKLYIGYDGEYFYSGVMDELRFYNRVLSQTEITGFYDSIYKGSYVEKLQNKLVAFYNFDGNLKDTSGFGNDGAIVGSGISFTSGIAGAGGDSDAVKFDGSGYIEVKDSDSLDIDKAFTFSAWILPDKGLRDSAIIHKTRYKEYSYWWYAYERFGKDIYQRTGLTEIENTPLDLNSANTAPIGQWAFLSVVYDGTKIQYYINGKPQDSKPLDKLVSHSRESLLIGGGMEDKYKGSMDELRIYNYALTDLDIAGLYTQRNTLTINIPATMTNKGTVDAKVVIKPLRGSEADVTQNCIIIIGGNNAKLLKYAKGKLTAIGKGKATIEVRYKNISVPYTVTIK